MVALGRRGELQLLGGLRRFGRLPSRDAVSVLVAERAGRVLGERVAVPLAVGGAEEGGDDFEVPLRDLEGLAPQVGEAEVDVELEKVDPGWALGHGKNVETGSDGI